MASSTPFSGRPAEASATTPHRQPQVGLQTTESTAVEVQFATVAFCDVPADRHAQAGAGRALVEPQAPFAQAGERGVVELAHAAIGADELVERQHLAAAGYTEVKELERDVRVPPITGRPQAEGCGLERARSLSYFRAA